MKRTALFIIFAVGVVSIIVIVVVDDDYFLLLLLFLHSALWHIPKTR